MNTSTTMKRRMSKAIALFCAMGVWMGTNAPAAGAETPYWRTTPPTNARPSSAGSGWTSTGGGNFTLTMPPGGKLYIGIENFDQPNEQKTVDLVINQVTGDPANPANTRWLQPRGAVGVRPLLGNVPGHFAINSNQYTATPPFRHLCIVFEPCPEWEYVEFENISSTPKSFRLFAQVDSECSEKRRASSTGLSLDTFEVVCGKFGVEGHTLGNPRITEMQFFPLRVAIDPGEIPTVAAAPHTGNWTPEFAFVTALGDPAPLGGVRFVSDGPGLTPSDIYSMSFRMTGGADSQYSVFAFDADAGRWQPYLFTMLDLPWYEGFEPYDVPIDPLDDGLHGQGGWQGWDDDPAFDAPVTEEQSHSGTKSVKIADDADLVHPFEGVEEGAWTFECWQYIPSDFASGGGGTFAGSYFNLLNTYPTTEESHWSVQMQFDPNDGLLKVFHGDGLNTNDVPFETDRWVKIQVKVDLEDDWTQVYYDDQLTAEYSWIGGVLGEGGGAMDIAAVDLFGQGTSSVFYDEFALTPLLTECEADLAEPFGSLDFSDIIAFLEAFAALDPAADFAVPFGTFDFSDVIAFLTAYDAGCGD